MKRPTVHIRRIYDAASGDGKRILVDRIWPRGITKADAQLDLWMKEIAPSNELRKWFAHDPQKWDEFRERYLRELKEHPDEVAELRRVAAEGDVTLLFAAKDEDHNNAAVLKELLESD